MYFTQKGIFMTFPTSIYVRFASIKNVIQKNIKSEREQLQHQLNINYHQNIIKSEKEFQLKQMMDALLDIQSFIDDKIDDAIQMLLDLSKKAPGYQLNMMIGLNCAAVLCASLANF